MKKIKIILRSVAALFGLAAGFAFSGPNQAGGWLNHHHYLKGTGQGEYTCSAPPNVTCTFVEEAQIHRFNTGLFILH